MATNSIPRTSAARKYPTREDILAVLIYSPKTGIFRWRDRPSLRPPARARIRGKIAGSLNTHGRRQIYVNAELFLASHLAWIIMTGDRPKKLIDHKNNIPSDDRWKNLRLATFSDNSKNRRMRSGTKSGFKGVNLRENGRFRAYLRVNKKRIDLGTFDSAEGAHAAYCEAAKKYHGEFARFK